MHYQNTKCLKFIVVLRPLIVWNLKVIIPKFEKTSKKKYNLSYYLNLTSSIVMIMSESNKTRVCNYDACHFSSVFAAFFRLCRHSQLEVLDRCSLNVTTHLLVCYAYAKPWKILRCWIWEWLVMPFWSISADCL